MINVLSKRLRFVPNTMDGKEHYICRMEVEMLGNYSIVNVSVWRVNVNGAYHWERVGGERITDPDTLNEIQMLYNDYLKQNGGVE